MSDLTSECKWFPFAIGSIPTMAGTSVTVVQLLKTLETQLSVDCACTTLRIQPVHVRAGLRWIRRYIQWLAESAKKTQMEPQYSSPPYELLGDVGAFAMYDEPTIKLQIENAGYFDAEGLNLEQP